MKDSSIIYFILLSVFPYTTLVHTAINWDCLLKRTQGNCSQSETRFYYDPDKNECSNFTYTGCHGNKNNFFNESHCLDTCLITQDFDIYPDFVSFYPDYNVTDDDYVDNNYTDYDYGRDHDITKVDERRKRACSLPFKQNSTDCNQVMQLVYYFESSTKTCKVVDAYCVQSYNVFFKSDECQLTCGEEMLNNGTEESFPVPTTVKKESENKNNTQSRNIYNCNLPSDSGPCRATMPKYFYNTETGDCELFVYGGCGGNANRFQSREFCELACYETRNATEENVPETPGNKETHNATEENVPETPVNKETRSSKYIVLLALCAFLLCFVVAFVGCKMWRSNRRNHLGV